MGLKRQKLTRSITLLYLLASMAVAPIIPTVMAEEAVIFDQHKIFSHLMVNMFLEKVDQGELIIYGQIISRSDLQSTKVAYIHDTNDHSNSIQLYFDLKREILIPDNESFYIGGITVEADQSGTIISINRDAFPVGKIDTK